MILASYQGMSINYVKKLFIIFLNVFGSNGNYKHFIFNNHTQGRRGGVKGVTVSRGPDLKKGLENYENKRKT